MADVASTLNAWSETVGSNAPGDTTNIGAGLGGNLRQIQAVVRQLASQNSIASATTTDLSTVVEAFVNITGNTTITGFGMLTAGMWKIVYFSASLTLTYNGTSLILPGAGNIITQANDAALLMSLGSGNWECLGYFPAVGVDVAPQVTVASATTTNLETAGSRYVNVSGVTTITGITLGNGHLRFVEFSGALTLTNGASLILPGGANITTVAGDCAIFAGEASSVVRCLFYQRAASARTRQKFTSGTSQTYTTPAGVTAIRVRMVGGGAGGGAAGTNAGTAGNNTVFGSFTAHGGSGGQPGTGTAVGGAGGTGATGAASTDLVVDGGSGGGGCSNSAATLAPSGGMGGASALGGAGGGGAFGAAGLNAAANSGSGGGGAGDDATGPSGGGGGAGQFIDALITSPSATYTYTVGASANGGSAGTHAGGNGAAGQILVDEFSN